MEQGKIKQAFGKTMKISLTLKHVSFFYSKVATNDGEGNGNPLQYSCLGNPMDSGAQDGQRVGHDLATNNHHHQPMKSHMKINQHKKLTLNRHYEKL